MARILFANFLVEILPLLIFVAGVVLVIRAQPGSRARRYVGVSLVSLPVGVISYIAAGIAAAWLRGDGHFYSFPFGGYSVSDNAGIGFNVALWIGLAFVVLALCLRSAK